MAEVVGVGADIGAVGGEGSPQPLDEDVVHPATTAVHRDAGAGVLQRVGKGEAGELRALIGVVRPYRALASSSAATQNSVSIVFDSRQARTLRLAQSMIATR